jgi:predicted metal-dependent hydrolase
MAHRIELGEIAVDVVKKDIKNVHLSVYPPTGKVRISAPLRMDLDTIRVFAISKLGWIKQQQKKITGQEREPPREYLDRESHYVWGKRYLLKVIEKDAAPEVELKHNQMLLQTRPATSEDKKQAVLEDWYRSQLKQAAPPLIGKWEPLMRVKVQVSGSIRIWPRSHGSASNTSSSTKWPTCWNPRTTAASLH